MREIVPGIHTWSWFSDEKGIDFNGFFVRGSEGAVVVDPPPFEEAVLGRMRKLGPPLAVVITNGHHLRRGREVAAHFGIPIYLPAADAPMVDPAPDRTFEDGDSLPAGLIALRIPDAKTTGETALHVPWANAVILGDALIGKPAGSLSLLPPAKFKDPAKAREGLRRLLEIPFDTILVGDGAPILERGKQALQEFFARPTAS